MNLKQAVSAIADAMEDEASEWAAENLTLGRLFRSYARQLKIAVSASDESVQGVYPGVEESFTNPMVDVLRRKAERDVEEGRSRYIEAEHGATMTVLVGGPLDGDFVPIDPNMPVLARTLVGATQVYEKRSDGKLHHVGEMIDGKLQLKPIRV